MRETTALSSILLPGLLAVAISCGQPESRVVQPEISELSTVTATYQTKRVNYVDTGGGDEALVLVHGWACDLRVWENQVASLSEHRRVIAIDLPGHGESEIPDGRFSMDLFARATAAVMDNAGVQRAVLVGHSNGAPVIRQFSRLFPDRTLALVVVDGPLKKMISAALAESMKKRLSAETFREIVAGFVDQMPGAGLEQQTRQRIRAIAVSQPQEAVLGGFLAAADSAVWEPDPIEVPLLLVLATQPSWDEEYLAFVKSLAPQAQIEVWEGVSHFLMMERPGEFDSLLERFLNENELF